MVKLPNGFENKKRKPPEDDRMELAMLHIGLSAVGCLSEQTEPQDEEYV
jgi:hypothetical protein